METKKKLLIRYIIVLFIATVIIDHSLFGQKAPKQNADGNLLPYVSYNEVIMRGMKLILDDHGQWFKGDKNLLKDENGIEQPAYIYFSNLDRNGQPRASAIDEYVSYPAFHHSLIISTLIKYYEYTGDSASLNKARSVANWEIAHSTPSDWAYGSMPYSTYFGGRSGGFRDGNTIMTDKPAMMGLAYLLLYKATGDIQYYNASKKIALTLANNQLPEGNWPFRVDPQTKEIKEKYTSSAIYAVELFDQIDSIDQKNRFGEYRVLAFNWIMQNPVQDLKWRGFYEDIAEDTTNRTNWDCIDVIRYLLNNNKNKESYLQTALKLNKYVEKAFLDKPVGYEPAEGIREQLVCFATMGVHSAHWAAMIADLYHKTGDKQYRKRAIQTMNYVTYHLEPNNTILVGVDFESYPQWWFSCHFGVILNLLDFINSFPEFSPDDETHLLNSTCGIQAIIYNQKSLVYNTMFQSNELIKLSFIPKNVLLNGKILPAGNKAGQGWKYDERTKLLTLSHKEGRIQILSDK